MLPQHDSIEIVDEDSKDGETRSRSRYNRTRGRRWNHREMRKWVGPMWLGGKQLQADQRG